MIDIESLGTLNTRKRDEKSKRIAVIDGDRCKPNKCGRPCLKFCPSNRSGLLCITVTTTVAEISEELCVASIGCNACVKVCPYHAIKIINKPQHLTQYIVHSYGRSHFKLHRMPIPRRGQVLGLLGKNGCGKTTALNILAGKIRPNLGCAQQPDDLQILRYFRGSELQGYLDQLYNKGLQAVIKPQYVDLIASSVPDKITVRSWIENRSQRPTYQPAEVCNQLAEQLSLSHLLDREIKVLSGGELQRFAMLNMSMQKSNAYFIDEPSAYLDVKQRLAVSHFINCLESNFKTVVEHDLVVLDGCSDYVSLIWGEPAAYGVFSFPINTKDGINQFLDGYLISENMEM